MNRLLLVVASIMLAIPVFAQDAPLGRLFLTPEQRAALDNARRNKIRSEAVAAAVVKTPKPPSARTVLINGVVKRSDGETIVWVNGKPVEGETPDGRLKGRFVSSGLRPHFTPRAEYFGLDKALLEAIE